MPFFETMAVALEALRANKLRSLLTMLGIVIGVSAVIAMVALGRGAQQSVKDRIAALGTTMLTVVPGQQRGPGSVASATDRRRLTIEDAQALVDRGTVLTAVEPEMTKTLQVVLASQNTNTSIVGTTGNVRRVIATNTVSHESGGDLLGNLSHSQKFAVLNNHRSFSGTATKAKRRRLGAKRIGARFPSVGWWTSRRCENDE